MGSLGTFHAGPELPSIHQRRHPVLVTPHELGFDPEQVSGWRPFQWQTIQAILESRKPLVVVAAPTGSGKSPIALACARMTMGQTSILVPTTQLQDQYMSYGFDRDPPVQARGRKNFDCLLPGYTTADKAPCRGCDLKQADRPENIPCPFYQQKGVAEVRRVRILNYPFR